jgi:hypothetical protein
MIRRTFIHLPAHDSRCSVDAKGSREASHPHYQPRRFDGHKPPLQHIPVSTLIMPAALRSITDIAALVSKSPDPLILVEGRRSIPETSARSARRIAALPASRFPSLRFRSGNATGADEAFAAGGIATAPERLDRIDPAHPDAGGTDNTIHVCRLRDVPVIFQQHGESRLGDDI